MNLVWKKEVIKLKIIHKMGHYEKVVSNYLILKGKKSMPSE
jgi:hypothetical protein